MKIKYILLLTGVLFALTGCSKHEHSYTTERIEPTCTIIGYDVYTCECGHLYNEQLDVLEHTYKTSTSEDFCRTIYTCECGDTYEEDTYNVVSCDPLVCYAAGDIITYNGPSEFYGVNEKTFAFNDEVTITGTFNTFTEIDVNGTKLYIKKDQLMNEKYVEPVKETVQAPQQTQSTQTNQISQAEIDRIRQERWEQIMSRPGAGISDGHIDGYTSQEDREKLDDGEFKDLIWE